MSDEVVVVIDDSAPPINVSLGDPSQPIDVSSAPGPQGPPGDEGPQGPAGPGGGSYMHDQPIPAALWTITHPLSYRPNVTIVDSTGVAVFGRVSYPADDLVEVRFSAAFAGRAYLS